MNSEDFKVGRVFTPKAFEQVKARAIAAAENESAKRNPINEDDIVFLGKVLESPDVNLFIQLV